MKDYKRIKVLPIRFQKDWQAQVNSAPRTIEDDGSLRDKGVFRLVGIHATRPRTYQDQRIIVSVVNEDGLPIPHIDVAFSYSTADQYIIDQDFLWVPPSPQKAFIVPTDGSGQIDQVQGSFVKKGEPGGVTVYILHPEYASDYVTGAGILADHTGLHLTFQLRRTGFKPLLKRLNDIETRLSNLEEKGGGHMSIPTEDVLWKQRHLRKPSDNLNLHVEHEVKSLAEVPEGVIRLSLEDVLGQVREAHPICEEAEPIYKRILAAAPSMSLIKVRILKRVESVTINFVKVNGKYGFVE